MVIYTSLCLLMKFSSITGFFYFSVGQIVDTVVMNPLFGTRKKGVDMNFLHAALSRCALPGQS